jgi:hypothetical protein
MTMTRPFSTATPESAMKPTAAEIENGMSRTQSAITPPVRPSGTALKTSSEYLTLLNVAEEQQEDQQEADRHDDREPLLGRDEVLVLPAPHEPLPGGELDLRHLRLRLVDERAQVAAAHVALHDDAPLAVLAADLVDALGDSTLATTLPSGTKPISSALAADRCRRRCWRVARPAWARPRRAAAGSGALEHVDLAAQASGRRTTRSKRRSPSKTSPASRPPIATATTSCTSETFRP